MHADAASPRPSGDSQRAHATLTDRIGDRYLERQAATERGRVFLLSFLVRAEEGDELGVFDELLARVDDDALRSMVQKHKADEERHASLLRACLARYGAEPMTLPPSLDVVSRIDRHAGRVGESFVTGALGVMEAYVVLQVIEERGVRQFPRIADALRPHDRESAAVLDVITRDEARHVRYARAISRRYAPSVAVLDATLARVRAAEERAFAEQRTAMLRFGLDHGLVDLSPLEALAWRSLLASSEAAERLRAYSPAGRRMARATNAQARP